MVYTGKSVRGGLIQAPTSLSGKRYKSPRPLPMGGSPFMMQIRGFQAAGRAFHYDMIPKKTMKKVYESIKKVALKIFKESQQTCPVGETKKLKSSARFIDKSRIMSDTGGKQQFIDMRITYGGAGSGVVYAVYVHEGHSARDGSWVRGRPWLVRAARRYKRSLLRAAKYSALRVWNNFARQISSSSKWVTVGGGRYGTGAGQGWKRKMSGVGPTVTGR